MNVFVSVQCNITDNYLQITIRGNDFNVMCTLSYELEGNNLQSLFLCCWYVYVHMCDYLKPSSQLPLMNYVIRMYNYIIYNKPLGLPIHFFNVITTINILHWLWDALITALIFIFVYRADVPFGVWSNTFMPLYEMVVL